MERRSERYLKYLNRQYILEVKKFLEALQKDASPKELVTIRKNVKQIFEELKKNSNKNNPQTD